MSAPTSSAPRILAVLALLVAACAAPAPPPSPPALAFPSRGSIAAGQAVALRENNPMGVHGTMQIMAEAPACGLLNARDAPQPLRLRDLAGRSVTPAFALRPAACPAASSEGVPYLALDRAVMVQDGLYAVGPAYECFLPHGGGGHCRPVDE